MAKKSPAIETTKTTVRLLPALHWNFKEAAARRRLSDQEAMAEAVTNWIAGPAQEDAEQASIIDLFVRIMHSGDEETKQRVLPFLREWQRKQEEQNARATSKKTGDKSIGHQRRIQAG